MFVEGKFDYNTKEELIGSYHGDGDFGAHLGTNFLLWQVSVVNL